MTDLATLDKTFHFIMTRLVETGVAPHYTEVAAYLGYNTEEGRTVIHELMASGNLGWIHPDTDWIASFAPFSSIPTQYRITVEGQQRWFGM